MGKIPFDLMEKYVYKRLGSIRDDVIVPSRAGIDVSVTEVNDELVLVSHLDPIVGAVEKIGWLAVNIACNDIATSGTRPQWIMVLILLPEQWNEKMLNDITNDIDRAAKNIGVSIIGGHTGYAPGLKKPLVSVSAMGVAKKEDVILSSMAEQGDKIIITKGVGLEGTAILASDFKDVLLERGVEETLIKKALAYFDEISVVKEALKLGKEKLPNAIHDATRGGVAEALIEMAYASNVSIKVYEKDILLREETEIFSKKLDFDPLWMISSGTLVISVPRGNETKVLEILNDMGIEATVCGEVVDRGKAKVIIERKDGSIDEISELDYERDELSRLWKKYPRV